MAKIIGDAKPEAEALALMRERGGTWHAYQCFDLGLSNLGHIKFLKVGPDCTFVKPPERFPGHAYTDGAAYLHVGRVNTDNGEIEQISETRN